jgi:hypothetical protein
MLTKTRYDFNLNVEIPLFNTKNLTELLTNFSELLDMYNDKATTNLIFNIIEALIITTRANFFEELVPQQVRRRV